MAGKNVPQKAEPDTSSIIRASTNSVSANTGPESTLTHSEQFICLGLLKEATFKLPAYWHLTAISPQCLSCYKTWVSQWITWFLENNSNLEHSLHISVCASFNLVGVLVLGFFYYYHFNWAYERNKNTKLLISIRKKLKIFFYRVIFTF